MHNGWRLDCVPDHPRPRRHAGSPALRSGGPVSLPRRGRAPATEQSGEKPPVTCVTVSPWLTRARPSVQRLVPRVRGRVGGACVFSKTWLRSAYLILGVVLATG